MSDHPILTLGSAVRDSFSGTLTIVSEKILRQFSFQKGSCTNAMCNAKSELPGSFFLKEGKLSKEQFETYLQQIKIPKPNFWEPVKQLANLPETEFQKYKNLYAVRLAKGLLTIPTFAFQMVPSEPIHAETKFVEGVRFILDIWGDFPMDQVPKICPDLDSSSSVFFDSKVEKKMAPLPLTPEENGLLTVVQHNHVVSEVFSSSFLGKEKITRLLLGFWTLGLVRFENAELAARKSHEQKLSPEEKAFVEEVRKHFQSLEIKNYYQRLKLSPGCTPQEIQSAFEIEVEKLSRPSLPALFYGEENKIPEKLIVKIQEAARALLNHEQRKEYDSYLASGRTGSFAKQSVVGKEQEYLSRAKKAEGLPEEAFKILNEGLTSLPESPKLITALARFTLQAFGPTNIEKRDVVLSHLKRGMEFRSPSLEIFESLGEWMEAVKQTPKAIESYKRALTLWPFSPGAIQGLERLAPQELGVTSVQALYKGFTQYTYYQILGLSPQASTRDIQFSYRECTKRFHPDRFFNCPDPKVKVMANEIYKTMVKAYTTLKSGTKRQAYNDTLK